MSNEEGGRVEPGTRSPLDGSVLEPVEPTLLDEVPAIVSRARKAQPGWAALGPQGRAKALERLALRMLERREEAVEVIVSETGKSPAEALLVEVATVHGYVKTAIKVAKTALKPEKLPLSPLEYPGKRAVVEAVPRGVVGIIAPWNYPLANFFKPLFPALLSGNAVVLKPSEHTPRTGAWLAELCRESLPEDIVGLVQGGGEAGAALLESGIDAVTFTGSVATGKRVAVSAGERLIPCSLELGGKDAAIVLADCDMDRTVLGIAQWALHNGGQNCAAIERVYVEEAIADEFASKLGAVFGRLRAPGDDEKDVRDIGPLQNEAQLEIVEEHVADALDKGAKLLAGGERSGAGLGYKPTVLDLCTREMRVVNEETFGPVVAVCHVKDADDAVAAANDSRYGLNGSVWTGDIDRGAELARRLEVGVAYVNNHSFAGGLAHTPWTGTKDTGPGIAASRYSYHNFVRRRTVLVDTSKKPDPFWMPVDEDLMTLGNTLAERALGAGFVLFKLLGVVGRRVKTIQRLATKD